MSSASEIADDGPLDRLFDADNYLFFHDAFMPPSRQALETDFLKSALALRPNLSLLDLGCGHGRHSNRLSPLVERVVGVDRNATFLELARQEAAASQLSNVSYIDGDIREITYSVEFDRILLVNTIFGLLPDADAKPLLARIFAALKPGGLFCVDTINRDTILIDLKPHSVAEKEGDYLIDRLRFDAATGRMANDRVYIRGGVSIPAAFTMRLHNFTELRVLFNETGFVLTEAFGAWTGEPFGPMAKKIIVIGEKPR